MFAYCLVDFFNLKLWERGQPISFADARDGVEELLIATLDALSSSHLSVRELTMRLYGGWHDRETRSATPARDILAKAIRSYPRRMGIRVKVQIADSPIAHSHLVLTDTLRRAPYSPSGHLEAPRSRCFLGDSTCSLRQVSSWLSGKCPEGQCQVKSREVIYAKQQKLVDTLITADSIFLAHSQRADVLVIASDDDDMVPALLGCGGAGIKIFNMRRRAAAGGYDALLDHVDVKIFNW